MVGQCGIVRSCGGLVAWRLLLLLLERGGGLDLLGGERWGLVRRRRRVRGLLEWNRIVVDMSRGIGWRRGGWCAIVPVGGVVRR
jgi:hypothetical protein